MPVCVMHALRSLSKAQSQCAPPPSDSFTLCAGRFALYRKSHLCIPRMKLNGFIPNSTFMYLRTIYIFPGSVCLFGCNKVGRPILLLRIWVNISFLRIQYNCCKYSRWESVKFGKILSLIKSGCKQGYTFRDWRKSILLLTMMTNLILKSYTF